MICPDDAEVIQQAQLGRKRKVRGKEGALIISIITELEITLFKANRGTSLVAQW